MSLPITLPPSRGLKFGLATGANKKSRGRLACATAFKSLLDWNQVLLKVEAQLKPLK